MSEMERAKPAVPEVPIHSEHRKIMLAMYLGFMAMLKPLWVMRKFREERRRIRRDS